MPLSCGRYGAGRTSIWRADAWVVIDNAGVDRRVWAGRPGGAGHRRLVGCRPSRAARARHRIGAVRSDRSSEPPNFWPACTSPRFRHSISGADLAAAAMVTARGLRPIRHFWHMQIDLDGPVEPGPAPDGIEIASDRASGAICRAVHAILDAAFADDPGDHPEPFDRWVEEHTSSAELRPDALAAGAGRRRARRALTASVGDDVGWVDWLAVLGLPSWPRDRRRAPAAIVRHVRGARAQARPGQRRRRERDRSDGASTSASGCASSTDGTCGNARDEDGPGAAVEAPGPVGRFGGRLRVSLRREPARP